MNSLTSAILFSSAAFGLAAGDGPLRETLKVYPKNLARQHLGTNLFLFNPTSQAYQPTEAAAAWLDDDVTTGWPVMAGKQHYLLTLAEPVLLSNLAVSTRPTAGTVTLYAGDEPAAPGAKSWTVVAKGIPLETINEKRLAKPFSRFAKYLLIETEIADPGPLFGLYVYGDRPAVSYELRKRDTPIDTRAVFGPYTNNPTAYSVAALYAQGTIAYANSPEGFISWQKMIDENPESGVVVAPTTDESGIVLKLDASHRLSRFAVLTGAPVAGKLDFFVAPGAAAEAGVNAHAASLEGLTPTITMMLDGSSPRRSIDFPQVEGASVLVRWTPEKAGEAISIRELNAFNEYSLSDYELGLNPEAVTELTSAEPAGSRSYDSSKDGRDYKDFKGGPPVVGEFFPTRSPYLPGGLGFPPNITRRGVSGPTPVSP
jgi:hypothetical protein